MNNQILYNKTIIKVENFVLRTPRVSCQTITRQDQVNLKERGPFYLTVKKAFIRILVITTGFQESTLSHNGKSISFEHLSHFFGLKQNFENDVTKKVFDPSLWLLRFLLWLLLCELTYKIFFHFSYQRFFDLCFIA